VHVLTPSTSNFTFTSAPVEAHSETSWMTGFHVLAVPALRGAGCKSPPGRGRERIAVGAAQFQCIGQAAHRVRVRPAGAAPLQVPYGADIQS
jgi:hypothetical protein